MTDLSDSTKLVYKAKHKIRFITAASLFDGHDASINIMRRILQASGAEVIHLGHNRSVDEIVTAALQEDVQGIAVSSYQGGHVEFFKYMIELLRARGGAPIQVFGGGGGVLVPAEIKELHDCGVARIYSPEDGQRMGLQGMINDMLARCDFDLAQYAPNELEPGNARSLAQVITALELGNLDGRAIRQAAEKSSAPVLGVTGTGGAGKSSLTDELVRRFRLDQGDELGIAVLSVDPTRRKTGGALLGDRIRMNAIHGGRTFMRSLATRDTGSELSAAIGDAIAACKAEGLKLAERRLAHPGGKVSSNVHVIIPAKRQRYLAEIAETVRGYHDGVRRQSQLARELQQVRSTQAMLGSDVPELDALAAEKA